MFALMRFALTVTPRVGPVWMASVILGAGASLTTTVLVGRVVGATPAFVHGGPDALSVAECAFLVARLALAFTADGVLVVLLKMTVTRITCDADVVINRTVASALVTSPDVERLASPAVSDEARRARGIGNRAIWVGLLPLGELVR